jgi:hypothetical protein
VVGRVYAVEHEGGRSPAVPLPHPSGASSWPGRPANRALLERALALDVPVLAVGLALYLLCAAALASLVTWNAYRRPT